MTLKLTERMKKLTELVREGSFVVDIGTDHAYLPIALVSSGKCKGAAASDINDGPVARAEKNIALYGLSEKIAVTKADGLNGIEKLLPADCGETAVRIDIIIAGMGGELIRDIIAESELRSRAEIRFVLQPMTMQPLLRRWLCENGFAIKAEVLSYDGNRVYQLFAAEYDGEEHDISELESVVGYRLMNRDDEYFTRHVERLTEVFEKRAEGMRKASGGAADTADAAAKAAKLVHELSELI